MNKKITIILLLLSSISLALITGCGTTTKATSDNQIPPTTPTASVGVKTGKIVDPYVVGAILFEDKNGNGIKDPGEQISSISDSLGTFTFTEGLTSGSYLIIDTANCTVIHNGVTYNANLKFKVDSTSMNIVITPLTTLIANSWTDQQIIDTLTTAGLSGITTADLRANPMEGIDALSAAAVTAPDLKRIKAALMINAFLTIVDGISHNGFTLTYALFNADASRPLMLQRMVTLLNNALDPTVFASINTIISNINAGLPPQAGGTLPAVTAYDVIKGAIAVNDVIIKKVLASAPSFLYQPSQSDITNWTSKVGPKFYLLNHINNPTIRMGFTLGFLSSMTGSILLGTFENYKSFVIDPIIASGAADAVTGI